MDAKGLRQTICINFVICFVFEKNLNKVFNLLKSNQTLSWIVIIHLDQNLHNLLSLHCFILYSTTKFKKAMRKLRELHLKFHFIGCTYEYIGF